MKTSHSISYIFLPVMTAVVSLFAAAPAAADPGLSSAAVSAFLSPAVAAVAGDVTAEAANHMPRHISADDILSKVYAIADCQLDSATCVQQVIDITGMTPVTDEYGDWLDSIDGFRIEYADMSPEVSAVANYDNGQVSDFAFFFLFPYAKGEREWANDCQSRFSGTLLQELKDMGLELGADPNAIIPEYFTVETHHGDRPVDIILREDDNQFVLAVHVIK